MEYKDILQIVKISNEIKNWKLPSILFDTMATDILQVIGRKSEKGFHNLTFMSEYKSQDELTNYYFLYDCRYKMGKKEMKFFSIEIIKVPEHKKMAVLQSLNSEFKNEVDHPLNNLLNFNHN